MKFDKTIELNHGSSEPKHAIIWLHGLGATANDFPPIVPELGLNKGRAIRFIFPQAPDRPITINGGMMMPGWYDIKGMDIADKQDAKGMAESKAMLDELINQQIALGVKSDNIIIAGFSQGGAVAYHTGVRSEHKLAGILALSTYIPFADQVALEYSDINLQTPILAHHGTHDPVVPVQLGKSSVDVLHELGFSIQWQTYPMAHQVNMEQIKDIGVWINQTLD
ncbi:MAG: dienelactone hydrolase family protein [Acidiferrobacterales bacterium]|nr:dienelactone hydrolase family protein [Acidiferrobacterales bacterium]